jgi:catechol 2,3-dioxygenase-like lactoylglutathione lyase family enzyme
MLTGCVGKLVQELLMTRLCAGLLACCFSGFLLAQGTDSVRGKDAGEPPLRLGNFSVSLAVRDIAKSREFYEKLGFRVVGGDQAKNWLVLQNETTTIGLFQGFFDKNSLTFNPGWDRNKKTLPDFDDVRAIQETLKSRGLILTKEADVSTTGPAYLTLMDPDGNPVLIDQHVPKPGK